MAQLKDLIVNGATRLIGDVFTNKLQVTTLNVLTGKNETTYGPGDDGQVLISSGTSAYWASTFDATKLSGTLAVGNGGTGSSSMTANRLVWTESATKLTAGYHYADSTHISIGTTNNFPDYKLYVNGSTYIAGTLYLKGEIYNINGGNAILYTVKGYNPTAFVTSYTSTMNGCIRFDTRAGTSTLSDTGTKTYETLAGQWVYIYTQTPCIQRTYSVAGDINSSCTVTYDNYPTRLFFRLYSFKNTTAERINKYEDYYLPAVDPGRDSNKTYNILTTKSTVTVAQGGTGAATFSSGSLLVGNGTNAIATIAKTPDNTANTVVVRDGSGNFSAGTITATLSGNATSADAANLSTYSGAIALYTDAAGKFGKSSTLFYDDEHGTLWASNIHTNDQIYAGRSVIIGDTNSVNAPFIGVKSIAGSMYLGCGDTQGSTRFLWLDPHGDDLNGKAAFSIDTNNNVTFLGNLKGGIVGYYGVNYGPTLPSSSLSAGQMFFQTSTAQYELPAGGTTDQVLVKNSNTDRDVKWATVNVSGYLPLTGGTLSGDLSITKNTPIIAATHSVNNLATQLYVDSNGVKHGVRSLGYATTNNASTYTVDEKWIIYRDSDGEAHSDLKIYGAVWNDYAEMRKTNTEVVAGQCVIDNDDGSLSITTKRLLPGAQVVSDTFGFTIGQTENNKTPLAVSGRVLVYTYKNRNEYHAGMAVCSAPDGTVDIMTREEIMMYPDCIVGIVSEIPDYEIWGADNVQVDGRIWIKVK